MAHDNSGKQLNTFHLFAGAGGGILADLLLGHNPIGACEIEPYPRNVLLQRQRDGILPEFPIWDDIRTLDGRPWRGTVGVLAGGFPCQDISSSGGGKGLSGERSGLWFEYLRLIEEIGPEFVFAENSPNLRTRGLATVIKGLASLGYDSRWCILGSSDFGAAHVRKRMWILAYPYSKRQSKQGGLLDAVSPKKVDDREADWFKYVFQGRSMPYVCGEDHAVAHGVDRLKAIGNGQDPVVAANAFKILSEGLI